MRVDHNGISSETMESGGIYREPLDHLWAYDPPVNPHFPMDFHGDLEVSPIDSSNGHSGDRTHATWAAVCNDHGSTLGTAVAPSWDDYAVFERH